MTAQTVPALASSLRSNVASTVNSLEDLLASPQFNKAHTIQIQSVIQSLQKVSAYVADIQIHLADPKAVCTAVLHAQIAQSLSECSLALGPMLKQLQRLDGANVDNASGEFWVHLGRLTATHSRLFDFYGELLRKGDETLQNDALQSSVGDERISQATDATDEASEAAHIFDRDATISLPIREKNPPSEAAHSQQPAEDNDIPPTYGAPPPYSPSQDNAGEGSSAAGAAAGETQSGGWFSIDGIKKSMAAIASAMKSKPDPFVPALCEAIARGDVEQAKLFISQGAKLNGYNENGDQPLKVAVMCGNPVMVKLLVDAGTPMVIDKRPAVFGAAKLGKIQMIQIFLDYGANLHETDITGKPYFVDVVRKGNYAGIKHLLELGADANAEDITGQPVVVIAAHADKLDVMSTLLDHGANANATDITGQHMLATAILRSNHAMIDLLLQRGATTSARDVVGNEALAILVTRNEVDLVFRFLERGANPNAQDMHGVPCLAVAVEKGNLDIARALVNHGAKTKAKTMVGQPVLICAMTSKKVDHDSKVDLVELLLSNGAPTKVKDAFTSRTAMQVAQDMGDARIIGLLKKYATA